MSDETAPPSSQWCLVGNIVEERPWGEGGKELKRGTKPFAPGARVYCLPGTLTDQGGEDFLAIGRHRNSGRWVGLVVRQEWVTNLRPKLVHHPEVLLRVEEALAAGPRTPDRPWTSRDKVEAFIAQASRMRN